jgi:stage II sporulation protein D
MTNFQSCSEKKHQRSTLKSFARWFCGDDASMVHHLSLEQIQPLISDVSAKAATEQLRSDLPPVYLSEFTNPEGQNWKNRVFPTKISHSEENQGKFQKVQNSKVDFEEVDICVSAKSKTLPKSVATKGSATDFSSADALPVVPTTFLRERHFLERCFFGDLFDQEQCLAQLPTGLSGTTSRAEGISASVPLHPKRWFYQRWLRQFVAPPRLIAAASVSAPRAIVTNSALVKPATVRAGWFANLAQPMPMAMLGVLTLPVILSSTRLQPGEFRALGIQSALGWSQSTQNAASTVVRLKWDEVAANIPSYLLLPGFKPPQGRFSQESLPQLQTAQQKPVLPPKPAGKHQPIPLRVAIADGGSSVNVQLSTAGLITDERGSLLGEVAPNVSYVAQGDGAGVALDRFYTESGLWIKSRDPSGLIAINGKWYRGNVQLKVKGQELLAVNHVELEQYLYSVVGAEMMPSWPLDALKAQAVAARSYAIAHIVRPANKYFDIGATPQWQAYQGFEKEADSTRSAVDETRGLLLTYKGNIVETLYASSDSLVQEVHQGFGMSQEGAAGLAEQRFNYQQILNYFYPGTQLAWLQLNQ